MSNGWAAIFAHLDDLEQQAATAAAEGLRTGAAQLEARAKATKAYSDDTGATRAGTVAYVIGGDVDDSAAVDAALSVVEDKNPGKGLVTDAEEGITADEVVVILTVPTVYEDDLETRGGGDFAHLAPALDVEAANLTQAAVAGLRKLF